MEGIDLALLIQIFKGFKSTLPVPRVLPICAGRGSPFFRGSRRGAHPWFLMLSQTTKYRFFIFPNAFFEILKLILNNESKINLKGRYNRATRAAKKSDYLDISNNPLTSDLTAIARLLLARLLLLAGRALSLSTRLSISRRSEAVSVYLTRVSAYFLRSLDWSVCWRAVTNIGKSSITCTLHN